MSDAMSDAEELEAALKLSMQPPGTDDDEACIDLTAERPIVCEPPAVTPNHGTGKRGSEGAIPESLHKKVKVELEERADHLDTMVTPLEDQRRQLQAMVTEATTAILGTQVPRRQLPDDKVPFYYCSQSYTETQDVPWNDDEGRPMTLAEAVRWLQSRR